MLRTLFRQRRRKPFRIRKGPLFPEVRPWVETLERRDLPATGSSRTVKK